MDVFETILRRRTIKAFTGEGIPRARLESLIELATWAPNHRMTEPWRFSVVSHGKIPDFLDVVLGSISENDHPKLLKKKEILKGRLPKLGAFIAVTRTPVKEDPMIDREDYAACCSAVQNLMLGATGMGLGSFWSTAKVFDRPPVRSFLEIPEGAENVGSIWLGVPAEEGRSQRRPVSEVTTWIED